MPNLARKSDKLLARGERLAGLLLCLVFTAGGCHSRKHSQEHAGVAKAPPKAEETCDADGWCAMKLPGEEPSGSFFCAVWAASASDAWAVGNTLAHWDGVRWSPVKGLVKPSPAMKHCVFRAIHGASADAVWAVGAGKALFWDGKKHTEHALPFNASAVFASAKDDAWAVSESGDLAHWDGAKWAQARAPVAFSLTSVFCARTDDCWAAGDRAGGEVEPHEASRILHWDGNAWQEERIGMSGIRALSGTGSDDVWAVGPWGAIHHFDGRRWTPSSTPAQRTLYAVRAAARDDVWATGEDGFVMHFDGKQWLAAKPTWPRILDLSSVSRQELWAVNGALLLRWRAAALRSTPGLSKDLWDPAKPTATQQQLNDAERARHTRYLQHLAAGRVATKAASYAAAAAAFTAALEQKPGDSRAYSERGYAAYLARNFVDAQLDLERAAERADERSLRAQTFYNLGLVRQAQGEDGTSAFALSNFLNPTPAAQQRLNGKNACAVDVDLSPAAETVQQYPDWLTFYNDVSYGLRLGDKPATSAAARKLLCERASAEPKGSACNGPGPWLITDNDSDHRAVVVNEAPTGLWAVTASWAEGGIGCPLHASARILYRSANTVVLQAFGGVGSGTYACDADAHECTEQDWLEIERDPESHQWIRGCNWQGYEKYEVLDLASRTFKLVVTRFEEKNRGATEAEQVQISVDARGIALKGPGCDQLLPLPAVAN